MKIALFSDIHANWEALETAIQYTKSHSVDQIVVLGDTVGYGANPNECFDWVVNHASFSLMGNHEKAMIDPSIRSWFNEVAREASIWTSKVMDQSLTDQIEGLIYSKLEGDLMFAHGSPDEPKEFHYIFNYEDAKPAFHHMQSRICFVGHTHVPGCFCEQEKSAEYLQPGIIHLDKEKRYILNPGSVGQPRDKDMRLAFGIFDTEEESFEIVRLDYDKQKAADKIRKAGLPDFLADRLL